MRRTLVTTALAGCLLLVVAGPAVPQERVQRDKRGDLRAPGLTGAERKALDIVRVRTLSDGAGLLIVDVKLAGNFNGLFGRGNLRRAVAGIRIQPRRGRPTLVVTMGDRGDPRAAKRGPGDPLLIDRDRGLVRFILVGIRRPRRVLAATTPRLGRRRTRAAQKRDIYDPLHVFGAILSGTEPYFDDAERIFPRQAGPDCADLDKSEAVLQREVAELRADLENTAEGRRRRLELAIRRIEARIFSLAGRIQRASRGQSQGLPEDFAVSWASGASDRRICVYVTGRPGQAGDVTINPPPPQTNPVQAFQLDSNGRATVEYVVPNADATYSVSVRWQQSSGQFRTKDGSVPVTGPNGPSPPSGFPPCSPP